MPAYDYICLGCESLFEARRSAEDPDPRCPSCGDDRVRRRFTPFATASGGAASSGCACGGACACGRG